MTQCPKCGGNRVSGPHFIKNERGVERLRFHCLRCGYEQDTPTLDAGKEPVSNSYTLKEN
jgi:predicted Zn-ribbon and HTH transcriptional regulator